MRQVMGIHLHDDHLAMAVGSAAAIAGDHPRTPDLLTQRAQLWWPPAGAPRWARAKDHPGNIYRHYLDHITDTTLVYTCAGRGRHAHQLIAATLYLAVETAELSRSAHVGALTIVHPGEWNAEQVGMLRRTIGVTGLARSRTVQTIPERTAVSRGIGWAAHMGTSQTLADQRDFVAAWGGAMIAATAVTRVPVPSSRVRQRVVPRAPHRRSSASIAQPLRSAGRVSPAGPTVNATGVAPVGAPVGRGMRIRWDSLGHV